MMLRISGLTAQRFPLLRCWLLMEPDDTSWSIGLAKKDCEMEFALAQRGRALIDFEVCLRQVANKMQVGLEQELARRGVTAETLPESMEARRPRTPVGPKGPPKSR